MLWLLTVLASSAIASPALVRLPQPPADVQGLWARSREACGTPGADWLRIDAAGVERPGGRTPIVATHREAGGAVILTIDLGPPDGEGVVQLQAWPGVLYEQAPDPAGSGTRFVTRYDCGDGLPLQVEGRPDYLPELSAPQTPWRPIKSSVIGGFYPGRARDQGVHGRTVVDCAFRRDGSLTDCRVFEETPGGWRFGVAGLHLAGVMRLEKEVIARAGSARRVRFPIAWRQQD